MFIDAAEKDFEWGVAIFGHDPADEKVHVWGFDDKGGFMSMEFTGWDGNKWNWSTEFVAADGTVHEIVGKQLRVVG